ncbi:hypothetical protein F8S09_13060 [Deinococcus sp. SDU3-2]|uniref:Uncharacterized protein n=1 Tax=Deinococcus terrestris TaxID=2651870 RepID=A0A7X1TSP4_9DEIO|nr:hypothetical protein [Deinococcus terrestris]
MPRADGHFGNPELLGQVTSGALGVIQDGLSGVSPLLLLGAGKAAGPPRWNRYALRYIFTHGSLIGIRMRAPPRTSLALLRSRGATHHDPQSVSGGPLPRLLSR